MNLWRKNRPHKLMRLAAKHHEAGRMGESEALCREVLRSDPRDFDALHLLAMIRLRAGVHADAIDHLRRALGQRPSDATVQNHLGDAYTAAGDLETARVHYLAATQLDPSSSEAFNNLGVAYAREQQSNQAEPCFSRAITIKPDWAVPHFNLGLVLKERHAIEPAMNQFRQAWMLDPKMLEAMRECAGAAAHLARANPAHRNAPIANAFSSSTSISIIFCSIDDAKYAATVALYDRLFADLPHELIPIRDARSLAEAYNRGVAASTGDVVVLSHDDIDILAPDFAERLLGHLSSFDVVGVIGATDLSGPTWRWSGHPFLRGWITHRAPHEDTWYAAVVDPNPVGGDVVVLDGVFFAARRAVCEEIPFDEETFDGFHLYDIDWSYRAAQAGYRLAAAGDLLITHASRGRFDGVWTSYADKFCVKHLLDGVQPPSPSDWAEAIFRSPDEVRAFFGLLATSQD